MSLQHILLGFLQDEPLSGYDLNKRLDAHAKHFWTTEQSQIYRALYRMQSSGWIEFETVIQDDSPNKKIYHLTLSGAEELDRWLHKYREEPLPSHIWLAKLYVGQSVDVAEIVENLQKRRDTIVDYRLWVQMRRRLLEGDSSQKDRGINLRLLTIDYTLRMLDAEIKWLDETLKSLVART